MTPDNIDAEALRALDIRGRIRDCAISGDGNHLDDIADAWEVLLATVEAQREEIERLKADHAPHYCAADHAPIRHWESTDPEELACPACHACDAHDNVEAERDALKADVSTWKKATHCENARADRLQAEVERLLQAIEKMTADGLNLIGEVGAASTRANRAEAEVERLRAALAGEVNCPCCETDLRCVDGCTFSADAPHDAARMEFYRAALRGEKGN